MPNATCPECGHVFPLPLRTTGRRSQNNGAWGFATQIAKFIGDDARDILYEAMKRANSSGYPVEMDAFGEVKPKKWHLATKHEASLVIDELKRMADFLEMRLVEVSDEE